MKYGPVTEVPDSLISQNVEASKSILTDEEIKLLLSDKLDTKTKSLIKKLIHKWSKK